ncbi:hypothetical protein HD554DRAFT_2275745 [Boletus coccyginus]|nr:hypothetical protein HD554DRAFT_2275745 [Boletus coccyginus]
MVPPPMSCAATPPPMQMTTLCMLPSHILTARQNMLNTGFYLGDEGILDNVHWVCDGRANRLAVKVATVSNPMKPDISDVASASYPSLPPEESIELAPLCAIARISTHDFWLTADASYLPDSKVWRELVNVKLSYTLEVPDLQPIRDNFQKPLGTEEEETAIGAEQSIKEDGSDGATSSDVAKGKTVLCHFVYSGYSYTTDAAAFSLENWPLTDEDARDELLSLSEIHCIVPIPAYNLQGKLIKPDAYRCTLEEALVEIYFNMSHWSITGKKSEVGNDVFTADIQMIRVISLPHSTVGGALRKCKISFYIDPAASPNKKHHTS